MKRPSVPFLLILLAAACGTAAATPAGEGAPATRHVDAVVLLAGQEAGRYSEETARGSRQIRDTVAQDLILARLGTQVEMSSRDVEVQDVRGHLTGGHYESTASKTTVTTDLMVKGHTLVLTTTSAGKAYTRELPFTGALLGPAGLRLQLAHAQKDHPLRFQTFVPELGVVAAVTVMPQGHETVKVSGASLDTLKLEYRIEGYPLTTTFWTDTEGYTVRALQDTPFGAIEIRRGKPSSSAARGAQLPEDVYAKTLAVSSIRLPDPRHLREVTLEISAQDAAGIEWPDLAMGTQRVISATPHALVLQVSQSVPGGYRDGGGPTPEVYREPNALLQSDDAEVQRIAASVAAGESDPWKVVLALQQWVNAHMHFDAGIAVAPAAEVARDRHGTCVGYAVLLASLARAQHIPSRLVMGYVYEDRIWGGHAWAEVLIDGQWRAVDAAEYAPGVADAARIAVIRDSGVSGTIEGVGELAKLFSRINIRTVSYRTGERSVEVPASATDHDVSGDTYANPWLGLTVVKPPEAAFTGLDGHWPAPPALVTVKQADAAVSVLYVDAGTAPEVLGSLLGGAHEPFVPLTWQGLPAIRSRSGDREALAATQGGVVWVLEASGPGGHALLDRLLPGVSLAQASR